MGFYSKNGGRLGVGTAKQKNGVFDLFLAKLVGDQLYSFSSFTFTSAGQVGRLGPSYETLVSSYSNSGATWATDSNLFTVNSGIQLWTVPANGTYRIQAAGAQKGAIIAGDFNLIRGEKLQILVGQVPTSNGGGGGSFVVKENGTTNSDIYVIAGGGGGKVGGIGGTDTTSNSNGSVSNGNGGNALFQSWTGPSGGGFFTSGQRATASSSRNPGYGFLQGGFGGEPATGEGGFGGGGSGGADSAAGGGGGGGYSGASSGGDGSVGGGAGSYPNGSNQSNQASANSGSGFVTITRIQ
jgi:hypothetical protein